MAGGLGKRLQPITINIPKPMIKIGKLPILEKIINQFKDQGFYKFVISVNYHRDQIKNYFNNGSKWNINVEYVNEDKPLGTAGSLGSINKNIKDPIIVMNADILSSLNFEELLFYHKENSNELTICIRV